MNKLYSLLVVALFSMAALPISAQQQEQRLTPEVMARLFPRGVVSPDYNKDGSVTFRLRANDATKVELECQMFAGTKEMTKDVDGVWSITVTPEQPDIYPYAFVVDGTKIADPNNMYIFPNEGFKSYFFRLFNSKIV